MHNARSIVHDSGSIIDDSRVMLQLLASFKIIIYDRQIFILRATVLFFVFVITEKFLGKIVDISYTLKLRPNWAKSLT